VGTSDEPPHRLDPLPEASLWLVDGYNALHCAPFRSKANREDPGSASDLARNAAIANTSPAEQPFWSETMRERLVAVARCFPDSNAEIWLIFDGARETENSERGERPKLRLQFAKSADDWIVARVSQDADPTRIVVVSGDRRLTGRTRHKGAAVVSPRLFLEHCISESNSGVNSIGKSD
jgi:hypothetical protein